MAATEICLQASQSTFVIAFMWTTVLLCVSDRAPITNRSEINVGVIAGLTRNVRYFSCVGHPLRGGPLRTSQPVVIEKNKHGMGRATYGDLRWIVLRPSRTAGHRKRAL